MFGGTGRRSLGIAYRIARPGRVTVEVFKGRKRVRRFAAKSRRARRPTVTRSGSQGRPRGDYRVRVTVRSGKAKVVSVLVSRRL